MLPFTHSRRSSTVLTFCAIALLLLLWKHDDAAVRLPSYVSDLAPTRWSGHVPTGSVAPAVGTANATLGFGAILAVSPRTTWRSVGLHAAARRTNLTITVPLQRPPTDAEVASFVARNPSGSLNPGSARAWLGHLQVMHAAANFSSALIIEDDSDWDVRVHEQAVLVAEAVRNLTVPRTSVEEWPWGEDWDVLWLGHCGERLPYEDEPGELLEEAEEDVQGWQDDELPTPETHFERKPAQRRAEKPLSPGEDDYITLYDPTLPPTVGSYDPRMSGDTQATRWVQHATGPICTFAYAVTAASVARMLAMRHGKDQAFDMWLHSRCRGRELRCFTVNPELFHHHVAAGLPSSLVNDGQLGTAARNYTENIMYSARCNWNRSDDALVSCRHG